MTVELSNAQLLGRYDSVMMNAFGSPKRVFVEGRGARLRDADGCWYTDLLGGLAVVGLGHANQEVNRAIARQLDTLGHISNLFASEPQIQLAERLAAELGDPSARVFFCNSGSEANETALKISRLTGRMKLVAMEGAFHGRTTGSLALTHNPAYREPFAPLIGEVQFVPFGDEAALARAVDERTAAVVLEVVQGENGVVVASGSFVELARRLTRDAGALLWIDEVQTGIGRCGAMFAHHHYSVEPDLVTLAKGLGNGFPIGACLATGATAGWLRPGMHGTTFGGNPVAAAAGLAVLHEVGQLLERVNALGGWLADQIVALGHPRIREVRGRGLLRGIVLNDDGAPEVVERALSAGFIVNAARPNVLRLAPPLVITREQLGEFVAQLPALLERQ